jgi:hypothetical protein
MLCFHEDIIVHPLLLVLLVLKVCFMCCCHAKWAGTSSSSRSSAT